MRVIFNPRPDITALELAQIFKNISFFQPMVVDPASFNAITPEVRRHMDHFEEAVRISDHEFVDGGMECVKCKASREDVVAGRVNPCGYKPPEEVLAAPPEAKPLDRCPKCGNEDHADMKPEYDPESFKRIGEIPRLTGRTQCLRCNHSFPTPEARP